MRSWVCLVVAVSLSFAFPETARAVTLRYGLVIGTNTGVDGDLRPLPSLQHAETEARELHEKLLRYCNFDRTPSRTALLVRPTRQELTSAVRTIADQMRMDEKAYGPTKKLFALFYTGHGLNGRLVLADGPIPKEELAAIFRAVRADFTIGVIDACFSGSLDPGSLVAKGFKPTPGINVFRELPEEVLSAEGSVWFASSGPDEVSYEDRQIGGVFTHFLIEGLEQLIVDEPGVTLDRLWSYARTNTVRYTSERNHPQNPQKIVAHMKERSSLYFSFPKPRDAALVLGAAVQGTFVLSYRDSDLAERVEKAPGRIQELAVYPGTARLSLVADGRVRFEQRVELRSGSKLLLVSVSEPRQVPALGETAQELSAKGLDDSNIVAHLIESDGSLFAGLRYQYGGAQSGQLSPRHTLGAAARFDLGLLTVEASAGYGTNRERFSSWGYRMNTAFASARGGIGVDIGEARAALLAGLQGGPMWEQFDDGQTRSTFFVRPVLSAGATQPISDWVAVGVDLTGGLIRSSGAGASATSRWAPSIDGSVSTIFRVH